MLRSTAIFAVGLAAIAMSSLRAAPSDLVWSIDLLYGKDEIFPSALACATDGSIFPPSAAQPPSVPALGDPRGLIAALVAAPRDDCPVTVEIAATSVSAPSSVSVRLPRRGLTYRVSPYLVLDHARLLNLHYAIPGETIAMRITLDGRSETKLLPVRIHSINDCLTAVMVGKQAFDTGYLAAAYVDEYNPRLGQVILRHALKAGYVDRFDGYESGDSRAVTRQVEAIYRTLKDLGFRYNSEIQGSVSSPGADCQWVRQLDDTLRGEQANCLDGAVLFASVLTQINLRAVLFLIPRTHAFVGVYRTAGSSAEADLLVVETTMVADHSFRAACERGSEERRAELKRSGAIDFSSDGLGARLGFKPGGSLVSGLYVIDIRSARGRGILPLAETGARASEFELSMP